MKDFKIIAVKALDGCNSKYLKILQKEVFYYLYNNYEISNDRIKCKYKMPENLFDIKGKKINISAIVGTNGSGKSSLVELIYLAMFNVAYKVKALPKINDYGEKIKFQTKLNLEIYYKSNNYFYKLSLEGERIKLYKHKDDDESIFNEKDSVDISDIQQLSDLFYSIVVNYSHFSLNSLHLGDWVKNIFHKNDGYQTPIVLNPFRKNGIIDINNEEYLTRSRLISNLLILSGKENDFSVLLPNKKAKQIKFTLNSKKANFVKEFKDVELFLNDNKNEMLDIVFSSFSKNNFNHNYNTENKVLLVAYKYILKKIYFISKKYKPYQKTSYEFKSQNLKIVKNAFNKSRFISYISELKDDNSHITFKLRQAINFVLNFSFYESKIDNYIDIDNLALEIQELIGKGKMIDFIPPSFFDFDIKFENRTLFNSLSSGEKQKIFGSTTMLYHLINISSVKENDNYIKYRNINIIFDEIELYYHPEMQRNFINDFINSVGKLSLENVDAINCIFITHSPFILSDIPKQNILFLSEKGTPLISEEKTFGANIHELLGYSFFLNNGFVGEFAKNKIEDLLELYKGKESSFDKISALEFINLIDDELISDRLLDIHNDYFKEPIKNIHKENEYEEWLKSELNRIKKISTDD